MLDRLRGLLGTGRQRNGTKAGARWTGEAATAGAVATWNRTKATGRWFARVGDEIGEGAKDVWLAMTEPEPEAVVRRAQGHVVLCADRPFRFTARIRGIRLPGTG